jgi:peptide/nickel transport system permease protein
MENRNIEATGKTDSRKTGVILVPHSIRLILRRPLGLIGAIITLILLFTGIFADFLAPAGYNEAVGSYLAPPSREHLLGTDNLGRDLLSRVIYGARLSVIIGLTATALSTLVSLVIGALSGFIGGIFDLLVQRLVDAWMCFPGLILLLILVSILNPSVFSIIVVLSLAFGITGSRVIRSAVIGIKQDLYVRAAFAIGSSGTRVLLRHILPNIMAPVIILFSTRIPGVILAEASMSFLGLGIPPPAPSWGGMLSGAARRYMYLAPWMAIWPGVALSAVVFGVNIFGDALRDLLDPKLKGGVGRYSRAKRNKRKTERIIRSHGPLEVKP